jgi:MraZ protein
MGLFLSTFLMRVDKKGRVSVPAPYRAALSQDGSSAVYAYASPVMQAIDARGRADFEALLGELRRHSVANLGPDVALLGGGEPSPDQILAAAAHEISFDGEGRIVLPEAFVVHAGIDEQVTFVGRGGFFQIWSPENFAAREQEDLRLVRERLTSGRSSTT